ncbi:MAG: type II toxin-antitoxin system HicB family antitoxin [Ignavibacteria bacterium]|nr:type II toxin-antitoxin system HicB family antitoxin [Ignavibacteria bacterium]
MNYKLSIVVEEDDSGFFAYCPELKGCMSQGNSHDEALDSLKEAIDLYLETLSEDELKLVLSREIHTSYYNVKVG